MKEPFVYLRPEIMREDALAIMGWLEDETVRRYLSDDQDVSVGIRQVMDRVNLPVLTHLFASGGRFYMVHAKNGGLIGFVRLVVKSDETEMVIVIGNRGDWGKRLGTSAIWESMKIAFFELRTKRMVAKIYHENKRSLRAFLRAGFTVREETPKMKILRVTMEEYMQLIQRGGIHMAAQVVMTAVDRERLQKMIGGLAFRGDVPEKAVVNLEKEMERARVVELDQLPPKVITMNSKVKLSIGDEEMEVALVYPGEADWASNKLSVLSPIGTAILGYSEGDRIVWDVPSGVAEIRINKVLYQPEAAGDYHL